MSNIWIEKYRPKTFDEVVGNEDIVNELKELVKSKNIPHIIFEGEPGVGKTTLAHVVANELGIKDVLEINASDERGIDTVRDRIKTYARTKSLYGLKIIILDEADFITSEAQHSLRRIMEKYSTNCRFIFTCNYISKIIVPLQSRCRVFSVRKLKKEDLIKITKRICEKEGIQISDEDMEQLIAFSNGDARFIINNLQSGTVNGKFSFPKIDYGNVKSFIDLVKAGKIPSARIEMNKFLSRMKPKSFLKLLYDYFLENPTEMPKRKADLFLLFAEYEYTLSFSDYPEIQMLGFVIKVARLFSS